MTLQELLDREEIRVLLATYNAEGDRGNVQGLASVFTEDGVLMAGSGFTAHGRHGIVDTLTSRRSDGQPRHRPAFLRHNLTTSKISFEDGETAHGRTYFVVFSDLGPDHMGVYTDLFRKVDGAWRIAHRRVRIDWSTEGSAVPATRTRV